MELLLIGIIVLVAVGYVLYLNNTRNPLDVNKDGKVDNTDSTAVVPVLTQKLDVNNDGKVDMEDVKEAVKKSKKIVKETTDEVVEKVKKSRTKKT